MHGAHNDHAAFLITGPSAAGKTTVARLLAARFARGAHVEGDFFRRCVVAGRHEMTPNPAPDALEQLLLRYRLGAAAADAYFEAGFSVIYEDVIAGPLLADVAALIRSRPLHVVVLIPSLEALRSREASREESGYRRWSLEQLRDAFAEATPRIGIWLDTSDQTPDETISEILARTTSR